MKITEFVPFLWQTWARNSGRLKNNVRELAIQVIYYTSVDRSRMIENL